MNHKNKNRLMKNKRGEDMLVDFWAILVFAIIVLLFFIIFAFNKTNIEKNIEAKFDTKDANFMLQAFLRAPALGHDSTKTIADIIAENDASDDFDLTKELFHDFFDNMDYYDIQLKIEGEHKPLPFNKNDHNVQVDKYDAESYIPGYNGKIYVRLKVKQTEYVSFTD
jgi:hypothetical protein